MSLEEGAERDPSLSQNRHLDTCPSCGKALLKDSDYDIVGDGVWFVYLDCTNCEWSKTTVLSDAEVDQLQDALHERDWQLKTELEEMERASPEEVMGALAASSQRS